MVSTDTTFGLFLVEFLCKERALTDLPEDLQVFVAEDNQALSEERRQWDLSRTAITHDSENIDITGSGTPVADITSSASPCKTDNPLGAILF